LTYRFFEMSLGYAKIVFYRQVGIDHVRPQQPDICCIFASQGKHDPPPGPTGRCQFDKISNLLDPPFVHGFGPEHFTNLSRRAKNFLERVQRERQACGGSRDPVPCIFSQRAFDHYNLTKHELLTVLAPFDNEFWVQDCPVESAESLMTSALVKMNMSKEADVNLVFEKLRRQQRLFLNYSDDDDNHKLVFVAAPAALVWLTCRVDAKPS